MVDSLGDVPLNVALFLLYFDKGYATINIVDFRVITADNLI